MPELATKDLEDSYHIKMAKPDIVATTFTFRTQRFAGFKQFISWFAMLTSTWILIPLIAFGFLNNIASLLMIMGLLFFHLVSLIYQNYKFILRIKMFQYESFSSLSFDSESSTRSFFRQFLQNVIYVLRFYQEKSPWVLIGSFLGIALYSLIILVLFTEGCVTRYDEISPGLRFGDGFLFSSKFLRFVSDFDACKNNQLEPCHIYLTLGDQKAVESLVLNF